MRTRFAPSPTGLLHLGHAFSALTAWDMAEGCGGEFLLRIEDIDTTRCRKEFETAIFRDLQWLGLRWPEPVMRQSERQRAYDGALDALRRAGLVYPCTCTRREILQALSAPQEGVPPSAVYPGICRGRTDAPESAAWRLDLARALDRAGPLHFIETGMEAGEHAVSPARLLAETGDVVLARRDIGTSYHLAVVVDDAAQGITHVIRGMDLFLSTGLHRLLQALLGLPVPVWHHHRLIRDDAGRRLAKRDDARAIARYREDGLDPGGLRRLAGLA